MKNKVFTDQKCWRYISVAEKRLKEVDSGKSLMEILKAVYVENFPCESERMAEIMAHSALDAVRELDYMRYKSCDDIKFFVEKLKEEYSTKERGELFEERIAVMLISGVLYSYMNQCGDKIDTLENIEAMGTRGLCYRSIVTMVSYCEIRKDGFPNTAFILDIKEVAAMFFRTPGLYAKANPVPIEIIELLKVRDDEYGIKKFPEGTEITLCPRNEAYKFTSRTKPYNPGKEKISTVKITAKGGKNKYERVRIEIYDNNEELCAEPMELKENEFIYCLVSEGEFIKFLPVAVVIDADNYLARNDLAKGEVTGKIKGLDITLYGDNITSFDFDRNSGGYIYINDGVAVGFNQPYTSTFDAMHWRNESLYNGGAVEVITDKEEFGILYSNGYGHGKLVNRLMR